MLNAPIGTLLSSRLCMLPGLIYKACRRELSSILMPENVNKHRQSIFLIIKMLANANLPASWIEPIGVSSQDNNSIRKGDLGRKFWANFAARPPARHHLAPSPSRSVEFRREDVVEHPARVADLEAARLHASHLQHQGAAPSSNEPRVRNDSIRVALQL